MTTATYTLYELNSLVRQVIEQTLDDEYWVEAELAECRLSRGHCYMELIQKDERGNTPIARAQAKCWQNTWAMLGPYFEKTTGQPLHAGIKTRLKVYPQFHETYGFSWIVTDIDPTYTLGDMAKRRQEIIQKLKEEGIFDLQKEFSLQPFCQNIAVISSQTAAGYGDFVNQLTDSPYEFRTRLYPATMQGEQVEQSIIEALNRIYSDIYENSDSSESPFDCVVIIRGGGATADLSGFDTLALAENVAQFPLPIITGIGHDRDESILDMVSFQRVKTPTAAAQFLISHLDTTMQRIDSCQERMVRLATAKMETEHLRLARLTERIPSLFSLVKMRHETRLDNLWTRLQSTATMTIEKQRHQLQMLQQRAQALDPTLLLKRGYSITLHKGRVIRNAADIKPGTEIETRLEQGTIISITK
jgi:exodeoxyribonuclease VII large subunit